MFSNITRGFSGKDAFLVIQVQLVHLSVTILHIIVDSIEIKTDKEISHLNCAKKLQLLPSYIFIIFPKFSIQYFPASIHT